MARSLPPRERNKRTWGWLKKSSQMWAVGARTGRTEGQRREAEVEADWLFERLLQAVGWLAHGISEGSLEDAERKLSDLRKQIKDRRLKPTMANTSGRTPEEAALFEEWAKGR